MAIKKVYIGSVGPFLFDDAAGVNDVDGDFAGQTQQAVLTDGAISADAAIGLFDSDQSNILNLVWNEDDTADRVLNLLVDGGDRSLTVDEDAALTDYTANADTDVSTCSWVTDEDDMVSDLDTKVPTEQSVKKYVDDLIASFDEVAAWLDDVTLGSDGLTSVPEVVLVPRAAALSVTQGGMYYSNVDDSIYVCTSDA